MSTFQKRVNATIAFAAGVCALVYGITYLVTTAPLWAAGLTVVAILLLGGWAIGCAIFPEPQSQPEGPHPAVEPLMRALYLAHDPGHTYGEAHEAIKEAVEALTRN